MSEHEHEWERGTHMAEAFGVDGRRLACAICGEPKPSSGVPAMTGEDRTTPRPEPRCDECDRPRSLHSSTRLSPAHDWHPFRKSEVKEWEIAPGAASPEPSPQDGGASHGATSVIPPERAGALAALEGAPHE